MGKAWTEQERLSREISSKSTPKCPECGDQDPLNFYYNKNNFRTNAYCTDCHKRRCSERYHAKTILEKRAGRASIYGLSKEEYIAMYEKQQGLCAICKKEPTTKRGLHIDHNHKTGTVRGLLCHSCNVGIGNFMDDPGLLISAIEYISQDVVE
jgi:hypothetical protein